MVKHQNSGQKPSRANGNASWCFGCWYRIHHRNELPTAVFGPLACLCIRKLGTRLATPKWSSWHSGFSPGGGVRESIATQAFIGTEQSLWKPIPCVADSHCSYSFGSSVPKLLFGYCGQLASQPCLSGAQTLARTNPPGSKGSATPHCDEAVSSDCFLVTLRVQNALGEDFAQGHY
eukprot:5635061-Amphidinium_carterae.1